MAESVEDYIARAIGDPGSIVERYENEPTARWSARAVGLLLSVMFGPDSKGYYAGTPATEALMDNAQLRGSVARLHEDVEMWRRRAREAGWRLGVEDEANV